MLFDKVFTCMNREYWNTFNAKSINLLLDGWKEIELTQQFINQPNSHIVVSRKLNTDRQLRKYWSKTKLVDYMVTNKILPLPCKLTSQNKPICEKYVIDQIYNDTVVCTICLDHPNKDNFIVSYCGHHYCTACFNIVLHQKKECSTCKAQLVVAYLT